MNITIHRGAACIGGCVTEYEHDGWKLFVDYGQPLPGSPIPENTSGIDGLTRGDLSQSALLITHHHSDHAGLIAELDPAPPIYMGEICRGVLTGLAVRTKHINDSSGKLLEQLKAVNIFTPGKEFRFGPFTVMPVTIDHSAFDAYAFKVEAGDVTVFHTGDFRTHGYRGRKFDKVIRKYVGQVDYAVCEATNINREPGACQTEQAIQQEFREAFQASKYNIAYLSSTNFDRLFAIYHAAAVTGRCFVIDRYQEKMMETIMGSGSLWSKSSIYRYGTVKPTVLINESSGFIVNDKFRSLLADKGYVLVARANKRFDSLVERLPGEPKQRYLSMWKGYVEKGNPAYNPNLDASLGDDYRHIHTSGHCDMDSLMELMEMLGPKAVIPLHTDDPEAFAALFSSRWPVTLLSDGMTLGPLSGGRGAHAAEAEVMAVDE